MMDPVGLNEDDEGGEFAVLMHEIEKLVKAHAPNASFYFVLARTSAGGMTGAANDFLFVDKAHNNEDVLTMMAHSLKITGTKLLRRHG